MNLTFIIVIIIAIISIALIFVLVKNIIKAIISSAIILVLVMVLLGSLFYIDNLYRFTSTSLAGEKLFLLEDNTDIVAGINIKAINKSAFEDQNYVLEAKLDEYSILYKEDNFKQIIQNHTQLFIFKNSAYDIEKSNQEFAFFLEENIKEKPYAFILAELRSGNIEVYPKTLLFRISERLPSWIFNTIIRRI